jgi:hypothetical protein
MYLRETGNELNRVGIHWPDFVKTVMNLLVLYKQITSEELSYT